MMFYALVALCLSGSALAQVPGFGSCPKNVQAQENFDLSKFFGRWYEYARFFHNFELNSKCNVIDYAPGKDSPVQVTNAHISGFTGKANELVVPIYVPNRNEPSKMTVKMPLAPFGAISDYWVLGTDYKNFAIVYGCTNYDYLNLKYAWILTRERNPSEETLAAAYEVINKNKIKRSNFWKIEQEKCWEKPATDNSSESESSQDKYSEEKYVEEKNSQEKSSQEKYSQEKYDQEKSSQEKYSQEKYDQEKQE